ncbi:hypothetical protein ACOSQ3_026103 [Xanthoceras sorbifolium]
MDLHVPSMFHFFDQTDHHHHHLLQLSSTTNPCQEYTNSFQLQDNPLPVDDYTNRSDYRRRRKASTGFADNENSGSCDPKKKKIMHRDIERQRRQETATLYRALRSLLPHQYLKGKRSISDHMHEAVNYIKHLQNKIQELSERRDELRRLSSSSTSSTTCTASEYCAPSHEEDTVTVRPCLAGVEVVVSTVSLSRVLQVLIGQGISIVNCVSTRINEKLLHTLECEVSGGRSVDLFELQQKLIKVKISR